MKAGHRPMIREIVFAVVSLWVIAQLVAAVARVYMTWKHRLWLAGMLVVFGAVAYVLPRL
jgi:hypothetical protein